MITIRRRSRLAASAAAVLLMAAGAVACGDDDSTTTTTEAAAASEDVTISDVWARPVEDLAATDRSAVYMVIEGGSDDDALLAASVPAEIAATAEVHETVTADGDMESDSTMESDGEMESEGEMDSEGDMGGGMMQMQEVDRVDVPAGGTVELEPGGFHVMLLQVQEPLTPGDSFDVTLTFELAGEQVVTAEVREP